MLSDNFDNNDNQISPTRTFAFWYNQIREATPPPPKKKKKIICEIFTIS